MEIKDIPHQEVKPWMSPDVKELRNRSPDFLVSLTENGTFENITDIRDLQPDQVSVLEGGELSACYLLKNNDQSIVVKFRHYGVDAEVEVTRAWQKQGVRVPAIISSGTVPVRVPNNSLKRNSQKVLIGSSGWERTTRACQSLF